MLFDKMKPIHNLYAAEAKTVQVPCRGWIMRVTSSGEHREAPSLASCKAQIKIFQIAITGKELIEMDSLHNALTPNHRRTRQPIDEGGFPDRTDHCLPAGRHYRARP